MGTKNGFDQIASDFLDSYFGRRPGETLGDAVERLAKSESPALAMIRQRVRVDHDPGDEQP